MSVYPQWRAWLSMGLFLLLAMTAVAHHGWAWTADEWVDITGEITEVRPRNPHSELTLSVNGESWAVELGQVWRNHRAGLTPKLLAVGQVIRIQGQLSANKNEFRVKAVRVIVDGRNYDLYPDLFR